MTSPPSTSPPAPPERPPVAPGISPTASALRSPAAYVRLLIVVAIGLTLDLWSKHWAFETLGQHGRRVIIPRVLEFQTMMNDGALFGIGSGQTTLFLVASVLALVLVGWMFAQSPARAWVMHIALGGILAGAVGNMYDRLFVQLVAWSGPGGGVVYYTVGETVPGVGIPLYEYPPAPDRNPLYYPIAEGAPPLPPELGHVRDFIKIPTKVFGDRDLWPWVFNVADMLLVGGVGILAWRLWREGKHPNPTPAPAGPRLETTSSEVAEAEAPGGAQPSQKPADRRATTAADKATLADDGTAAATRANGARAEPHTERPETQDATDRGGR